MDAGRTLDDAIRAAGDTPSRLLRDSLIFEINETFVPGGTLIDIGGGVSIKNAVLARLGMRVLVFDLFEDYYLNAPSGSYDITARKTVCTDAGVELIDADVFDTNIADHAADADIVTSLHVFEHFHRSPRPVIEQSLSVLKSGGRLRIEVPNAANLRKRVDLLRGRTNYPDFDSFYCQDIWNGHVREYTKGDLLALANSTGHPFRIFGRNFYGGAIARLPRPLQTTADFMLRPFPGLCGSLFLEIVKR